MLASILRWLAKLHPAFRRDQAAPESPTGLESTTPEHASAVAAEALTIYLVDPPGTLTLQPGTRTLGRKDADFPDQNPDIDLEPYGAFEKGVSRRHATIAVIEGLGAFIQDLDSTNGTFVNDQRLQPGHWKLLPDACHLRLGRLVAELVVSHEVSDHHEVPDQLELHIRRHYTKVCPNCGKLYTEISSKCELCGLQLVEFTAPLREKRIYPTKNEAHVQNE